MSSDLIDFHPQSDDSQNNATLDRFLKFLDEDMQHPHRVQPMSFDLVNRIRALSAGVEVNLSLPLLDENE